MNIWTDIMEIIVNIAFKVLLVIILFVITRYVKPWIEARVDEARARAGECETAELFEKISKIIAGAEQMANSKGYDNKWKKEYVVGLVESMGINVDSEIDTYIEGLVAEVHNSFYGSILKKEANSNE